MNTFENFSALLHVDSVDDWRDHIFQFAKDLGFQQTCVAIFPDPTAPIEANHAFQQCNYSPKWVDKYVADKMHRIDPTVSHCLFKFTPQIWSPELFSSKRQHEMYEEACGFGVRSGVTLPMHGANGELGILCFVNDAQPNLSFQRDAIQHIPILSCFRDFILESSPKFINQGKQVNPNIHLTEKELECLKWAATGKTSWEISLLMNCSESTVNFHFGNLRRKFKTSSRQQVLVKALRLGVIAL